VGCETGEWPFGERRHGADLPDHHRDEEGRDLPTSAGVHAPGIRRPSPTRGSSPRSSLY